MIKNGHLDIIVGTHSLLGSRVAYNNLGLLVVDEEQVSLPLSVCLPLSSMNRLLAGLPTFFVSALPFAEIWRETEGENCFL